jgi:hypothetical protein
MSTSALTEIESFHRFLGEAIQNGARHLTIDESVAEFRAYQEELRRFNKPLQESVEQARRGEARPLDVDTLKDEIRRELADEGLKH